MSEFDENKALFDADKIDVLSHSRHGLLWLKVKAISRKDHLDGFCVYANIALCSSTVAEKFRELYDALICGERKLQRQLDDYIKASVYVLDSSEEEEIASELYKMRSFSWGGDYANALDRHLVNRYVKKCRYYDKIRLMLESEIQSDVAGYVLCSWYNHWSTVLIENVFRRHQKTLPAIGNIKRVDFFIEDVPFDLKTTYLPANYVDTLRKKEGLSGELTALKAAARRYGILFDREAKDKDVMYEIAEKIKVEGDSGSKNCIEDILAFRRKVVRRCVNDPRELIQNLYENQGDMRFDASNRLFLILIDYDDFGMSWKLKRNPGILRKSINAYLDEFSAKNVDKMKVTFRHRAKTGTFSAISDVIFVIANAPKGLE